MRIIAGKLKGLKLNEFEYGNIRPTIDRVREAIFSKIQFNIPNATVLDLFGGTGAISLEFISRNAGNVYTVDNNPNSIKLIKQNFSKANLKPTLIESDYIKALKKLKNNNLQFDIIYLDPPFDSDYAQKSIRIIAEDNLLTDDGMIVYEHLMDKELDIPPQLAVLDEKKYGTVIVTYLEKNNG